jgi:SAM-dependent methyltransferase
MPKSCWLCHGDRMVLVKPARHLSTVDSGSFRVTDSNYGESAAVYQCGTCGFRQCTDFTDVLAFYEGMDDPEYEASRAPRALQADRLLKSITPYAGKGRLLDVGAGSGILMEAAARAGYQADGIEPSNWMVDRAADHGILVHHGVLPMPGVTGPYDVVTLVDVIEHVSDPVDLLKQAKAVLAPGGVGLVITPDVGSMAARVMGPSWWHYRLAHICYFDRKTLLSAIGSAGLRPVSVFRPSWFFTGDYLLQRLAAYIPLIGRARVAALQKMIIPLNLFDSLGVVFRHG